MDKLLKALEITQQHLPGSDLEKKLQKQVETIMETEEKKRYIRMLCENKFKSRSEIENLHMPFNNDLLFMYDLTHYNPSQQETERYRQLRELRGLLKGTAFKLDLVSIEEELLIENLTINLSKRSWEDMVDTVGQDDLKGFPKFRAVFNRFRDLLDLVR